MSKCPNRTDPVYQEMIDAFGENEAYVIYSKNGDEIPASIEEALKLKSPGEQLNAKANLRIIKIQNKVMESLTIQRAIYQKRKGGKKYVDEIDDLIKEITNSSGLSSLIQLIKIANRYTTLAKPRMLAIQQKIATGLDTQSEDQVHAMAAEMNEIKEFLSAFTILEEIEPLLEQNSIEFKQLGIVLETRRSVVRMFKEAHEELIANWLSKAANRVNSQLSVENKSYRLDVNQIKRLLHTATSDISIWEKLFGAQANSTDPLTGLIAASIKYEAFQAEQQDNEILQGLMAEYDKQNGNKSNPDEFNKPFMRDVVSWELTEDLDKDGKPVVNKDGIKQFSYKEVKRKAFHTEFEEDRFYQDFRAFKNKLPESLSDKEIHTRIAQWFAANTQLKNVEEIINEKRSKLSPSDFEKWYYNNTRSINLIKYDDGSTNADYLNKERIAQIVNDKIILFDGEFLEPLEKYRNPKFAELMKNPYYAKLYATYKEANERLHPSKQLKYGIIPQLEKSNYDKFVNGNNLTASALKKEIKDSVNVTDYDKNYGIQTPSGRTVKHVPIMFTDYMLDEERLSLDLLESTLKFSQMSNNYERMSAIEPYISLLTDMIEGNHDFDIKAREVVDTNSKGVAKLNALVKSKALVKRGTDAKVNATLLEFIDKVFYNEREIKATILGNVSLNKLSNMVMRYSALNSLALNVVSGVNNVLFGQYSNAVEAVAGKYFDKSALAKSQGVYMSNIPNLIGDINRGFPTTKLGKLVVRYDAIQGSQQDQYGKNVSGGAMKKLFNSNAAFFLSKSGEHYIQVSGMIAMMQSTKVKTNAGVEINLYDAYLENGELRSDVKWTKEDQFNFMQKLHKMNKELHGIYNKFDSPTIQRMWFGKLIMLFRKYIYTGMKRRYSPRYLDIEGADVYEGYFNTFFTRVYEEIKEFKFDLILGKNMTEMERQARVKVYMDLLMFAGMMLLTGAIIGDDDEDESWAASHAAIQARRLAQDVGFYVYPPDMVRLLRTPTVALSHYERLGRFFLQLANPTEEYQRKSGMHKKGDLKIKKRLYDVIPVLSRYEDLTSPEDLLTVYN